MINISIDTATKSLAVSIIEYRLDTTSSIADLYSVYKRTIRQIDQIDQIDQSIQRAELFIKLLDDVNIILDNTVKIHHLDVVDLIPNKKVAETDIIYRSEKLYTYLKTLDRVLEPFMNMDKPVIFLLEYQMGPNIQSSAVSNQLIYHFTKYNKEIKLIGPSLKNKISLGPDLYYSNFVEKYKTLYAANKNHTKANFLKFLELTGNTDKISHIKKSNVDDIADSVCMSLVYMEKK